METLKKQFDNAKEELGIAVEGRNKAERLLEAEKDEHEKLKDDLEFLQGNTIGSEEDTERKVRAMEIESSKAKEQASEMKEEADGLSDINRELEEKIKDARVQSIETASKEPETSDKKTAAIGSSLIVKNLTKETEHNFVLVNPDQADIPKGMIPLTNPIGKSLEGAKEGDEVKVGPTTFKILKLT
tara:strand:- start:28 stop:585 length:558 start_codon:yes stop_codon:yes gene_type:complete